MRTVLKRLNHIQLLVLGYWAVTLMFAFLLMLPVSSANGTSQSFIDAFFMAASGISTCGLTVCDIGSYYSVFGQIVLLCDIQVGGIGYMAFFVFIASLLNKKLSVKNNLVASESVSGAQFGYNFSFFNKVITFTFIFQLIGTLILTLLWSAEHGLLRAFYLGLFHSVNAFCTAGMSLFPDSLMRSRNSIPVNMTINIISLLGGIGFFVLTELFMLCKKALRGEGRRRLSVHSRLALITTAIVLTASASIIFFAEKWAPAQGFRERLLASTFQAISASTTDGFNTLDIGAMSATSLLAIMFLMFIGASPGSTGGGIKTTTLGVIVLAVWANLRGKEDVNFMERRLSGETANKAFTIFFLFAAVLLLDVCIMTATEKGSFLQLLFETGSALGNTGLSTGITSSLSSAAKLLLSITMFIGRVGPLTIGLALLEKSSQPPFKYPDGDVFVG